jgi:UDP-galactose transporter B1
VLHPKSLIHLLSLCAFGTVGQICMYVLIMKFKPSICTICAILRKVLTMTISILIFGHSTSLTQVVGIFIVFNTIFYEFYQQFNPPKPGYVKV